MLATRLAEDLKDLGVHQIWLDEWEINLGDSIIYRINQGLSGASYLVMCLSDSGIDSPWMSREWMSSLAVQLSSSKIKILPAKINGGSLPFIMADIKFADLTIDWNLGVRQIFKAII